MLSLRTTISLGLVLIAFVLYVTPAGAQSAQQQYMKAAPSGSGGTQVTKMQVTKKKKGPTTQEMRGLNPQPEPPMPQVK